MKPNQIKIMWPQTRETFKMKIYHRQNKPLVCLQFSAAKVKCRSQLLAHCACLYLGSSPSLEWQRQAGFWCHCSLVVMDANCRLKVMTSLCHTKLILTANAKYKQAHRAKFDTKTQLNL